MNGPGVPPSSAAFARVDLAVYMAAFPLNVDSTLIRGGYDNSPASVALCQVTGMVTFEVAGNAVTAHMLIAVERLMTVVFGVRDTRPTLIVILVVVEILMAIAAVQARLTGGFEPDDSGLFCFLPFAPGRTDLTRVIGTIMAASYCGLAATIVLVSYTYIYITVIRSQRAIISKVDASGEKGFVSRSGPGRTEQGAGDREHKVFYRCVGVVLVFACTYLLEFCTLAYKLISAKKCPDWIEALASTLTSADALATPVMMVLVSTKVAEAAAGVVGIRLPAFLGGNGRRRVQPLVGDVTLQMGADANFG
ncbi:hypothetical protein HK101_011014 [Irineochytrium annulatum]|nr:hypothetical protein HK101_011014 [Irineochytrium annulatum]